MKKEIESGKWFIKDIFKSWFKIPEYQRPYVWGSDQIIELLDDIVEAENYNNESEYFLGSMVLQKHNSRYDDNTTYIEYDVLDGQQRLTTLFLITAVIRDISNDDKRKKGCHESIYQEANPDDGIPERVRILFDHRKKVQDFISKYIISISGTQKIKEIEEIVSSEKDVSIKHMANALLIINSYFKEKEKSYLDHFYPFLRNKVLVVHVSSEKLDDAFRLFTVLNDRGLKLRNSDILKAENLRIISDNKKREDFAKLWEKIEEYFGDNFDNFLSHIRTILVKDKARINLLEEFEKRIYEPTTFDRETKTQIKSPPLLSKGEPTFLFVKKHFDIYEQLFNGNNFAINNNWEFDNIISMMSSVLPADYWVAPLLHFYDKFRNERIVDFLTKLDNKFSHDWIISLTPTERIENVNKIIKLIDSSSSAEEVLNDPSAFLIQIDSLTKLFNTDVYGRRYARYLLYKLDMIFHGHTSKLIPPKLISVEHILPQNPEVKSQWALDFSIEKRLELTDKLGNLVLISKRKNSSQSNLDYMDKKDKYFDKNIELFSNSIRVFNKFTCWTPKELESNHNLILEKLISYYQR